MEVSEIITNVDEEDKTTVLIQHPDSNYKSKTMLINESGFMLSSFPQSFHRRRSSSAG